MKNSRIAVIASVVLATGLGIATGGVMSSSAESVAPTPSKFELRANAKNLTYGSSAGRDGADAPDLVLVVMTNGEEGYVYRTELEAAADPAASPDAAGKRVPKASQIPAYASDGTTRLGAFIIQSGLPR